MLDAQRVEEERKAEEARKRALDEAIDIRRARALEVLPNTLYCKC